MRGLFKNLRLFSPCCKLEQRKERRVSRTTTFYCQKIMQKPNLNPPIKSVCTTPFGASASNPVFIIETYKNGTEWYRKYSDGVIEQGGWLNNLAKDSIITNNFITSYSDATSVSLHFTFISTGTYSDRRGGLAINSITKTQFSVNSDNYVNNSGGYYWTARGV